jgi:hypothetical protein
VKPETINRIKEALLISCFLLFLFSFSGKGMHKAGQVSDRSSQTATLTKQELVTLPATQVFQLKQVVSELPPLMTAFCSPQRETRSAELSIDLSVQTFLTIKPRLQSRFCYRLFGSGEDEEA